MENVASAGLRKDAKVFVAADAVEDTAGVNVLEGNADDEPKLEDTPNEVLVGGAEKVDVAVEGALNEKGVAPEDGTPKPAKPDSFGAAGAG